MTAEQMTGRDLDAEVARAMGWRWFSPIGMSSSYLQSPEVVARYVPQVLSDEPPEGKRHSYNAVPAYSAADCSGLAPVLAWLREHMPAGGTLELAVWRGGCGARYVWLPEDVTETAVHKAATLPEAACRLVVAWAAKRGGGP